MFMNFFSLFFFILLIMGSLVSISSSSIWGAWMGLEINLLSFIPLISSFKSSFLNEAFIKYFIVQALASSMLLFFFLSSKTIASMNSSMINTLVCLALLLKIGAAPFHFWFPEVMESLSWIMSFILMTWQKFAPIVIISFFIFFKSLFFSIIMILSIIFGSLGGLNQTSLRKIMAFSSINHIGWMIAALFISNSLWSLYFFIYSLMNFIIIGVFSNMNFSILSQIFFSNLPLFTKSTIFITFLSLLGMPPLLGFLPKWMIIQMFFSFNSILIITFMMIMSAVTLYFYLRLMLAAYFLSFPELKWKSLSLMTYSKLNVNLILLFNSMGIIFTSIFIILI